jgi:hypothetical protein
MNVEDGPVTRQVAQDNRRAPTEPTRVFATFDGEGKLRAEVPVGPIELMVEATDAGAQLAPWLDDEWWAYVLQRWVDRSVTVQIAPTSGALLHPLVLHQLGMLRRVEPGWRLVGHAYADDVVSDEDVAEMATSPYHEVRFMDRPRVRAAATDRFRSVPVLEELFGRVRTEQARRGARTPILVRLPSTHAETDSLATPSVEPAGKPPTSPVACEDSLPKSVPHRSARSSESSPVSKTR